MKDDSIIAWSFRLLLTVALVAIGAWLCSLFHIERGYGPFYKSMLILSFIAGAFAAVLLLRVVWKAGVPLCKFASMGLLVLVLAWLLSLLLASLLSVKPFLGIRFQVQDSFGVSFKPSMALWVTCVRYPWLLVLPWIEWAIVLLLRFRQYDVPTLSLAELPERQKTGSLGTVLFFSAMLLPLIMFAYEPFLSLAGGQFLSDRVIPFESYWGPGDWQWDCALTPRTIKFALIEFSLLAVVVLPHLAVARWISNRNTRLGFIVFSVCTGALRFCMLCILTQPFYWLMQYTVSNGITCNRLYGLLFGLVAYFILIAYKTDWLNLLPLRDTRRGR